MRKGLCLVMYLLSMACFSQTITLQILDRESGTPVVGAWVKCNEVRQITNENGMVVFASSCQELTVKHVSYADSSFKIPKEFQEVYKFYLASDRTLGTVVIQGQRSVRVAPFQTSINGKYIERFPTFLGQTDAFYILQMQSGVSPSQEGNVGFHVRGGEAFENMIRLDGAIINNPQHLFGMVSPINAATINSVDFVKDGIDASNGGKASSFVDFHTRKGNFTQRETRIDVGLVNSGLVHSGYMIKDKLAYSISGRAGNLNAFSRWMDFKVSFSDLMMNMSWNINDKSKLDFTYFQSKDEMGADSSYNSYFYNDLWTNQLVALNYHLKMGKRTQLNVNVSYSQMLNQKLIDTVSMIQDLSVWQTKAKWNTYWDKIDLSYGVESNIYSNAYTFRNVGQDKGWFSGEHAAFGQVNYVLKQWNFSAGNRLNYFQNYQVGDNVWSNDVRLKTLFHFKDNWQFYAAFDQLSQFNFTLAPGIVLQPDDFLMALDRRLGPIKTNSSSVGSVYERKNLTVRTTAFYKHYSNFMDIKEDAILYQNFQLQDNLTNALKNSYGIETSIHWHWRSLDWFTNYTYSKTMLQSDEINFGIPYPAAFDRPHIFNTTASWHKKDSKWKFGAAFYLMSGRKTSLTHPVSGVSTLYTSRATTLWILTPRNSVSLPTYHRLDLSGSKEFSHKNPKVKSFLTVSIYNVYNHLNAYDVILNSEFDVENSNGSRFLSLTLFPIIPSVSYSVRF